MRLGITGKAGCGKSTLARMLGMPVWSFAGALKDEVAREFNIPRHWMDNQDQKTWIVPIPHRGTMTVREVLQWWGTDVRRAQDPGYWTKGIPDHCVIDDVRFPNEAASCDYVIELLPYDGWKPGPGAGHISENRPIRADLTVRPVYGALPALAEYIKREVLR